MAHYAFLSNHNIVTDVIVGIDENELIEGKHPEIWYGEFKKQRCIRTSYNGKIRKNYAGIGYYYSDDLDAFIPPKPYESWILNQETCLWEAPTPYPSTGNYYWNLELGVWSEILSVTEGPEA
jgi:hypothetical protein